MYKTILCLIGLGLAFAMLGLPLIGNIQNDSDESQYCNIEGLLCRDYAGRNFTNYVLDKDGNFIPCDWNDTDDAKEQE